jgi:hypothetical protein
VVRHICGITCVFATVLSSVRTIFRVHHILSGQRYERNSRELRYGCCGSILLKLEYNNVLIITCWFVSVSVEDAPSETF